MPPRHRPVAAAPLFEQEIAPLLAARCGKCHGADKAEAGLDLRERERLSPVATAAPPWSPASLDESPLWERIEKGEMPPKGRRR